MQIIHGVTQRKLQKLSNSIDRACCNDFSIFFDNSESVGIRGEGTCDDPLVPYAILSRVAGNALIIKNDGLYVPVTATPVTPNLDQVLTVGNISDQNILLFGATDQSILAQGTVTGKVIAGSLDGSTAIAAQLNATSTGTAYLSLNSTQRNFIDRSTAQSGQLHFTMSNGATLTNTIFPDGRMSGANAINSNEFITLQQLDSLDGATFTNDYFDI